MNEKWTEEQLKAINLRGKHILVSASAGSGKTSVMTERVLSLIDDGYTLDQMLIVTFTRAAAADMKEKLAAKIISSGNPRVKGQLEALAAADISTLHSFCQKLISAYFYTAGIDPEFSVLEDSGALLSQGLDTAIKEFCLSPSPDFAELYEMFTDARSDYKLKNLIADNFYSKQTGQLNAAPLNPLDSVIAILDQRRNKLIEKAERLKYQTLQAGFRRNFEAVTGFKDCLLNGCVPVLPRGRIEPQFISLNEDLKKLKDCACDLINDYQRVNNALSQNGKYLNVLDALSKRTQEIFDKLKAEKSRLDFNDLEHCALKIINSEAGAQIREKYKFIFVDEYQDINPVQDQIIESLKGDNFLFLVGDIKQSIYAFRGCEPDIFLSKRAQFLADADKEVIELNMNHRSLDCILSFANAVFSYAMTNDFGGVDYYKNAKFILTQKTGGSVNFRYQKNDDTTDLIKQYYDDKPGIYDITKHEKTENLQAGGVVGCVLDILFNESVAVENGKTRPVLYKDIAVLCRSMSDTAYDIYSTLSAQNIPVTLSQEQNGNGIYAAALINYLRLISNPLDDEALINALKSYFGGFTDDELAQIRLDYPDAEYFYEAAYKHSSTAVFRDKLDYYRDLSGKVSVGELCGAIVSDYEYFQYLFIKGAYAVRQLEKFLEEAQKHEGCLHEFLNEVKEISLKEEEADAVSIMTIHASKGLEFPFVILIDVQKKFNLKDLYGPILIHKGCCAIKHYDYAQKKEADSPEWLYNYFSMLKRRREEELRLLYVAVTRAKYRLDIFSAEPYKEANEYSEPSLCNSYSDWLSPFYQNYRAKAFAGGGVSDKPSLRAAPQPDERLVALLNKTFKKAHGGGESLGKHYVTALIESSTDEQQFDTLFSQDDRAIGRGVLYHKAMELVDFNKPFDWNVMDDAIKKEVERADIESCFNTIKALINGRKYYKEKGFMLRENNSLIQGVVDLLITDGQNAIILDYKTGSIHPSYEKQLSYYALAVSRILNLNVTKKLIYSFSSHKLIEI